MSELVVKMKLIGNRQFLTGLERAKAGVHGFATTTNSAGKVMTLYTRRTWLMNQALFTLRRLVYGVTLGFVALGAVIVKWGFDFNKQIQEAQIGFRGFIKGNKAINAELTKLFYLAAITPFNFPDILLATRRLIPYNRNLEEVNATVEAISNSLAAGGVVSKQYFTRATIQFAHILALGRVTGRQINALATDNIPLTIMLAKYYNTTTGAIVEMVHKGLVPAGDAVKALIAYQKEAGYAGKNFALATKSVTGAWATFQDIMRFAAGRSEKGLFERVRVALVGIDKAMLPLVKGNKPITIYMVANAIDSALSPKTHAIINTFNLFLGVVQGLWASFKFLYLIVHTVSRAFGIFGHQSQRSAKAIKYFGWVLGVAIGLMWIGKTALYAIAIADLFATAAQWLYNAALTGYVYAMVLAVEATGLGTLATLGIIGAIVILAALLVLAYIRCKRFHDAVNKIAVYMWNHKRILSGLPFFGPMITMITIVTKHWKELVHTLKQAVHYYNKLHHTKGGSLLARATKNAARNYLGLQHGGSVTRGGGFMVGEHGPEIVSLPAGAAVTPVQGLAGAGSGVFSLHIEPAPVIIDGRKVSEVVFKHRLDVQARR